MADFTYTDQGLFYTFSPESASAVKVWNEIAAQNGGDVKVLHNHAPQLIDQLKIAGYTARKARPVKIDDDALAEGLGI